ncbi:predicted protein [Uncinocarpus reesii 1704]|uniref:DUF1760-domain-containing protein n=1 Tax=Uncinocarpus reesii (strain UAMH 1704) TaxID=336963 RepID=C4JUN1_UNCRE|nr:uncharacterized protein UREG_04834 [Uncinocarpus reesii 1704]EEP79992.1 predicted protein [Uncinocarpus reesii 1704]
MATEIQEDPLIEALPPASDYLTYLTILEYQLTPARLPTLHRLLQDETLTTNIGWDLVQLLLPLLPASEECLQDVARLGNPREVILRVSDALMKLHPSDDQEDSEGENLEEKQDAEKEAPLHIMQFNCLISMLAILHSRIKTQYPSRFIATSLHAALEAYTEYPTSETTTAILEFLRDIYGAKRPALPPRNASEQLVSRACGPSGPDPEAEAESDDSLTQERVLTQKLLQFGLVEVLKTYLLHCTSKQPPGMQWTLRLHEKLDPGPVLPTLNLTEHFSCMEYAKERDATIGKITALSRDFGLETEELLRVAAHKGGGDSAPLDFDNVPQSADDIALERHGCLILLAARYTTTVLFGSAQLERPLTLYPEISTMFENFINGAQTGSLEEVTMEIPTPLLDSLLALALISGHFHPNTMPNNDSDFGKLVLSMVACTRAPNLRQLSRVEKVPTKIFSENPSTQSKYNLIRQIFDDESLQYARESAISWFKHEVLAGASKPTDPSNPFISPQSFSVLFWVVYKPLPDYYSDLNSLPTPALSTEWMRFISRLANFYTVALNFYYMLCKSGPLHSRLDLQGLDLEFRAKFLHPVREFAKSIRDNDVVSDRIVEELGEDIARVGKSAADVVLHVIGEIEAVE